MSAALATPSTPAVPFLPPPDYAAFLAQEPHYITKFLRWKKCPEALFEDFSQSLHLHLMSIGPKGKAMGIPDRVATYCAAKSGGGASRGLWITYINTLLIREYGKLINRNKSGFVRGDNVISLTVDHSRDPQGASEFPALLDGHARESLTDFSFLGSNTKVMISTFMDRVRAEDAQLAEFAQNFMVYDTLNEVAEVMGITRREVERLQARLRDKALEFRRGI